jgi:predicted neuraminidase
MATTLHSAAIPSKTRGCHASNLLQLPQGILLCAWFGKDQGGTSNISIWLSRLEPGSSWTEPKQIASADNRNCQNPVLFKTPGSGQLWLFHTSQEVGNQEGAELLARTSDDDGGNWSEPRCLLVDGRGSLSRQPVQVLDDGTWTLPVFNCKATQGSGWTGNEDSSVLYTRDGGDTWASMDVPNSTGAVHMNIIPRQSATADWVALFRSRFADHVFLSASKNGLEWSAPQATALPNPNCGIAASRLPNGKPIIVFNRSQADIAADASKGRTKAIWGLPRKTLTVGISNDDGLTWKHRLLEDFDDKEGVSQELSYPSILVDPKGTTHIAYTFHRQHIKHVHSEDIEGWVDAKPDN